MILTFIILTLLLSALFSGTEIAFISASKLIVELKKKKGTRRGKIIAGFYEKPSEFMGVLLIGNNVMLVAFTTLMTIPLEFFLMERMGLESPIWILLSSTILITIVVLIFGEFLPKTLFRLYADGILYFFAYPLRMFKFLLTIPARITTYLSNFILIHVFKAIITEADAAFTRLDLENFVKSSVTSEAEEDIDTELFERALNLRQLKVRECMVPRTEIESIDVSANVDELLQVFKDSSLSRIIVYKEDIDNVLGYVHHQQLLEEPKTIKKIVLDIPVVPEVMKVRDLLNHFIKNRLSIACVVDEFGGTSGIITLEDILEEIFGEIEDEHDQEEYLEQEISETEYLFSGRLEIDYLNDKYEHLELPDGEYHTLSGYLVMTTEAIPEQGVILELEGYKFILELVSDTKIETIRVIKLVGE
ncbi:MAG: putative hemolysin [Paraglaciecola sp.]|jgi:CBS domain containing-hemolysin-like protein